MQKPLLDILRCPVTRGELRLASASEIAAVNDAIAVGSLMNAGGDLVGTRLSAALVTADAARVYRVDDDIPVLLADEAILSATVASFTR
jgi:uncharacterized protein YbaR (Trm112 family)